MSNKKKRGDNVASSRNVASPRFRLEKNQAVPKFKTGSQAQAEFENVIKKMFNKINVQLKVEPSADTINNIINKKDKKKLN